MCCVVWKIEEGEMLGVGGGIGGWLMGVELGPKLRNGDDGKTSATLAAENFRGVFSQSSTARHIRNPNLLNTRSSDDVQGFWTLSFSVYIYVDAILMDL